MKITINKQTWERGIRDGFAGQHHQAIEEYSYSSGWIEGEAARQGYEVSVQVAEICGSQCPPESDAPILVVDTESNQ